MIEIFLASLLLGALAGVSAGLFGIGGGLLIVPFLSWLLEAQGFNIDQIMLMAVATSLATALFTSAASVRAHYLLDNIDWRRALRLAPSLLLGSISGAVLAEYIRADLLRVFFIIYLVYTSLQMLIPRKASTNTSRHTSLLDYPIGLLIGLLSAILGIGGGSLTVPYLASSGLLMKNAVATASTCVLPIAFSAAISYIALGWHKANLADGSLGYVYLPAFAGIVLTSMMTAQVGARLAHRLPAQQLKRYFAVLLLLITIKMAW